MICIDELDQEESNLILKFQDIINLEQPDIIIGYNTFGFDNKFLYERCEELCIEEDFGYISKLKNTHLILRKLYLMVYLVHELLPHLKTLFLILFFD